jgi:hypothetical protein
MPGLQIPVARHSRAGGNDGTQKNPVLTMHELPLHETIPENSAAEKVPTSAQTHRIQYVSPGPDRTTSGAT